MDKKTQKAIDYVVSQQEGFLSRSKKYKLLKVLYNRSTKELEEISTELRAFIKANFVQRKSSTKEKISYIFPEDKTLDLYFPHEAKKQPETVVTATIVLEDGKKVQKLIINEDYITLQKKLIETYANEGGENSDKLEQASSRKLALETVKDYYQRIITLKESKSNYDRDILWQNVKTITSSFKGVIKSDPKNALKVANAVKAGEALTSKEYVNTTPSQTMVCLKKIVDKQF